MFGRGEEAGKAADEAVQHVFDKLRFLSHKHFDLPTPSKDAKKGWKFARDCLREMDRYRAPGDKIACIMNACRAISTLLAAAAANKEKDIGADEFLPALIYTVIRANPRRLASNLAYIGTGDAWLAHLTHLLQVHTAIQQC